MQMRNLIETELGQKFNLLYKKQFNKNIPNDLLVDEIFNLLKDFKTSLPIKYYAQMGGGSYETSRSMVCKEICYMDQPTFNLFLYFKECLFKLNSIDEYMLKYTKMLCKEIDSKTIFPYPDINLKDKKEDVSLIDWESIKYGMGLVIFSPILIPCAIFGFLTIKNHFTS